MKKIFYLPLLVLSIAVLSFPQTITFDKSFYANPATQVIQTDDGGYLLNCVGSMYPHNWKFIKTNQFGFIEFEKEYPEIYSPGKRICKTLDGDFAAVGYK